MPASCSATAATGPAIPPPITRAVRVLVMTAPLVDQGAAWPAATAPPFDERLMKRRLRFTRFVVRAGSAAVVPNGSRRGLFRVSARPKVAICEVIRAENAQNAA